MTYTPGLRPWRTALRGRPCRPRLFGSLGWKPKIPSVLLVLNGLAILTRPNSGILRAKEEPCSEFP